MSEYPVIGHGPPTDAGGDRIRRGGCSCGAVRFEVRGEPLKVGICHCQECRKATGAVFVAYADWRREAFSFTGASTEFRGRRFCPECGSRLFHLNEGKGLVEVMFGALDDAPTDLLPAVEGWTKRREPWLTPIQGLPQFQEDSREAPPN